MHNRHHTCDSKSKPFEPCKADIPLTPIQTLGRRKFKTIISEYYSILIVIHQAFFDAIHHRLIKSSIMRFQSSIFLALALAVNKVDASSSSSSSDDSAICLAECVGTGENKECVFEVSRDQFASELGYFKFSGGGGDCSGTNPTLGKQKK